MLKVKPIALLHFCFFISLFSTTVFSQLPKKLKTIVVDAGHGGAHDPGAIGQYEHSLRSKEKDITLAISKKLVAELKKQLQKRSNMQTLISEQKKLCSLHFFSRKEMRISNNTGHLFTHLKN